MVTRERDTGGKGPDHVSRIVFSSVVLFLFIIIKKAFFIRSLT